MKGVLFFFPRCGLNQKTLWVDGTRPVPVWIKHYGDAPGGYTMLYAITGRGTESGWDLLLQIALATP